MTSVRRGLPSIVVIFSLFAGFLPEKPAQIKSIVDAPANVFQTEALTEGLSWFSRVILPRTLRIRHSVFYTYLLFKESKAHAKGPRGRGRHVIRAIINGWLDEDIGWYGHANTVRERIESPIMHGWLDLAVIQLVLLPASPLGIGLLYKIFHFHWLLKILGETFIARPIIMLAGAITVGKMSKMEGFKMAIISAIPEFGILALPIAALRTEYLVAEYAIRRLSANIVGMKPAHVESSRFYQLVVALIVRPREIIPVTVLGFSIGYLLRERLPNVAVIIGSFAASLYAFYVIRKTEAPILGTAA